MVQAVLKTYFPLQAHGGQVIPTDQASNVDNLAPG